MAPALNDKSADKTADKIENHLKDGGGLKSIRDEVEKVRKEQGNNVDKSDFKDWMDKVSDKLHKDGILPKLEITYNHDKIDLTGISGDGKLDGKGSLITSSGKDGRFNFKYNKDGELTSIKDSKGDIDYSYKNGEWTNTKDNTKAKIAVDTYGNIRVMHDNGTEFVYRRSGEVTEKNSTGEVTSQTRADGLKRTYEYNDKGQISKYTQTGKDGCAQIEATRNADGTYDMIDAGADGKIGTDDDRKTQLKNLEIDSKTENLKITKPDGSYQEQRVFRATLMYDKSDRLTDLQTTNGKMYHYDYNGNGKEPVGLTITSRGADKQWSTDDDKQESSFKLADGKITATDADGKTESYKGSISIDDRGRAIVANSDRDVETTYGLSGAVKVKTHGHVTQVINPDGTESNACYKDGELNQVTLFKGTDHEQDYVMKDGKWMMNGDDGQLKESDVAPTVDDNGNIFLSAADGNHKYTQYTPMGDVLQGYDEPKLEESVAKAASDDASKATTADDEDSDAVSSTVAQYDQLPGKFGVKLLKKLNLPVTQENLTFLNAWQKAEGGSDDNPFNTTQPAPGAEQFNSAGVKRYPDVDTGLEATAKTLQNGNYDDILASLQQGKDASASADALAASPWGTGSLVQQILAG